MQFCLQKADVNVKMVTSTFFSFLRGKSDVDEFACPYRVRAKCQEQCVVKFREVLEKENGLKFLNTISTKCKGMQGDTIDPVKKGGREVLRCLESVINVREINIKIKE